MKSLLSFISFCILYAEIFACFEDHPLESNLQEYLALKKSCSDTLFPEPPCCGNSTSDKSVSRIINGQLTGFRELTWTVYINRTVENSTTKAIEFKFCGGSLLNSRWVLSAVHCFINPEFRYINGTAHIGEWNVTSDPDCIQEFCAPKVEKINIAQVITHPGFKWELLPDNKAKIRNDIALLHLARPVTYSEFINPICLPFKPLKKKCFENQKAIVAGWGKTVSKGEGSPVKLQTTLTIWETDKCENLKSSIVDDFKDKHCASADRNYPCYGDSGGPLSLKLPNSVHHYLVGVVSGGYPECNAAKHPAYFSRINFKWIVDVILKTEATSQKSNK